jgi:tRNA(Ile)-lysidine synthase
MTRPPRAAVRAAVRAALADLGPGDRVLVACSGGPDSLALLAAALVVGRELGLLVGAVIVDHGLQPDSGDVAVRAAEQARILGCDDVDVRAVEVTVGPGSGGVEAAARRARHAALVAAATGRAREAGAGEPLAAARRSAVSSEPPSPGRSAGAGDARAAAVLLGHTRDDQAETVLLGLARGSGTRSLAGMASRDGLFRRPLLDLPRAVVAAAAAQAAHEDPRLQPWTDPHNADAAFTRVRVREHALPALEAALGPGVVDALARTARLARADADALDAWADQVWAHVRGTPATPPPRAASGAGVGRAPSGGPRVRAAAGAMTTTAAGALDHDTTGTPLDHDDSAGADAGGHRARHEDPHGRPGPLPAAVVTRVVRRLLVEAGCPAGALTADHVARVTALLHGPATRAEVALPGGLRARREGADLVVRA